MSYTYTYPRQALTVDAAVFRRRSERIEVLLIQRKNPPFQGSWALPGGFVDMDETLEAAVSRELHEETGLQNIELTQMQAFSTLGRDPRGPTVSIVFLGTLNNNQKAIAGDDASKASWFLIDKLPSLGFDHDAVLEMAVSALSKSGKLSKL